MTVNTGEFPQLVTGRLLLREVSLDDREAILQNYGDSEVTEYFMEPLGTLEQAEAIADEYAGCFRKGTGIVWAITLQGDDALVGTCGYEVLSKPDRRGKIGFDLGRPYWGRGLMQEALRAAIGYGFECLDLNRVEAYVLAENTRSIRVLKSLHFETEGVLREHRWFKGRLWDNVVMALLKKEWQVACALPGPTWPGRPGSATAPGQKSPPRTPAR